MGKSVAFYHETLTKLTQCGIIYLSIYLSIYLFIYLSIYLSCVNRV